jgi:response regulator RpfG family c-di-GMP phosphodiesterase
MSERTRRTLTEGLCQCGYDVITALDGEGALGLLKKRKVDVVVTSIDLLGMNGIQLCRAVARMHPHIPIIAMSHAPDPTQIGQAMAGGASDLIGETSSSAEVYALIERNLERKAAAAQRIVSDRAEILFKAIRALTAAIDARSHYAARHSSRVTQLSLMVGTKLGLSTQEMVTLELAAQLHDVGKIGTPDAVLTKPSVLTDEEWVDVLKHPALGGTFLACVPELSEIAAAVRHHHEHFSGTGYPDGLQGEAIPLFSRIIAVADAYDAMTSERPYRPALPHSKAAEELAQHSGSQFDPVVVDHLLNSLAEKSVERKAA